MYYMYIHIYISLLWALFLHSWLSKTGFWLKDQRLPTQGYHSQQSIHHAQVIPFFHRLQRQSLNRFSPLERYLSRNPPPKDCYVWWKFASFWTLKEGLTSSLFLHWKYHCKKYFSPTPLVLELRPYTVPNYLD